MPTPTVQALLTEYAAPTYTGQQSVFDAAGPIQTLIGSIQKQIIQYRTEVTAIETSTPAPSLAGQLEQLYQTLGAMQREADNLATALRLSTQWQTQWVRYMAAFQAAAAAVDATVPVASVTIGGIQSPVKAGTTDQATATVKDASGNPLLDPVTWQTSNAAIATVSATGLITGVAAGTVTITATAGGVSATASVTIN